MQVKEFCFISIALFALQIQINGMPTQLTSSVSQLNYLFDPSTSNTAISIEDAAQIPKLVQNEAAHNITKFADGPAAQFRNLFEQLPWLDEALFWLGGVLSVAKFVPQLIRKFIFRRDIAWSDMC